MSYVIEQREAEFQGEVQMWTRCESEALAANSYPTTFTDMVQAYQAASLLAAIYPIHEFRVVAST